MTEYETPTITELGTVQELTLDVHKPVGKGDVLYVGNTAVGEGGS
jgi:hypothetical protein